MRRAALAAALLLGAACSRSAAPAPPPGTVAFTAEDASFTAAVPPGWRVDDAADQDRRAAFFGPPDGPKPYAETITVFFHPSAGRWKSARDFLPAEAAGGQATPATETRVGGDPALETMVDRALPDPHLGLQRTRTRALLVTTSKGFFVLEHTYPADGPSSPKVFADFLAAFRPGAATE